MIFPKIYNVPKTGKGFYAVKDANLLHELISELPW